MAVVVVLAGCRLDARVEVAMGEDGTGTVTVTAIADAELAERFPDVAEQLRFDDAESAGWAVDGPTATDDGGATIVLTHDFRTAREATALLRSLGGPMADARVTREVQGEDGEARATNAVGGTAVVHGGRFDAFADQALLDAVGGTPFGRQLEGLTPADTMSITLDVGLPGEIERTNGTRDGDVVRWSIPMDGSRQALELVTRQEPTGGSGWAGPVATVALVALVAWLALSLVFVGFVLVRRSRARGGP